MSASGPERLRHYPAAGSTTQWAACGSPRGRLTSDRAKVNCPGCLREIKRRASA